MATIRKRGKTYTLIASLGYKNGKQQLEYKTWVPPEKDSKGKELTEAQVKKLAKNEAKRFEEEIKEGLFSDVSKMAYKDYVEKKYKPYAKTQISLETIQNYQSYLDKIMPLIGDIKMADLKTENIQDTYTKLCEDGYIIKVKNDNGEIVDEKRSYSENYYKRVRTVLSATFNYARKNKWIRENPCQNADLPKVAKKKKTAREIEDIKFFTAEEVNIFLNYLDTYYSDVYNKRYRHTPGQMKCLYYLAFNSRLRRSELVALRWSNVDFAKNTIYIEEATKRVKDEKTGKSYQYDGDPKSESSIRSIVLSKRVMDSLKRHKKEQNEYRNSISTKWVGKDHLFIQADGKQIALETANDTLGKIIEQYNETTAGQALPDISLHGTRHTHATLLIANGIDIVTVANRLGHRDAIVTLNTYAHAIPKMDEKAAIILDNVIDPIN